MNFIDQFTRTFIQISVGILFLCSFSLKVSSQSILNSDQKGPNTYIFKIDNKQALDIILGKEVKNKNNIFSNVIDSVSIKQNYNYKKLRSGQYIESYVFQNNIISKVVTVPNCFPTILNNEGDFIVYIKDSLGAIVKDAVVKIKNRTINFDKLLNAYRIPRANCEGILTIKWSGLDQWYSISRNKDNPSIKQYYYSFINTLPGRIIVKPIQKTIKKLANSVYRIKNFVVRFPYRIRYLFHHSGDNKYNYKSVFILNKPRYKPQDTILAKVVLVRKRRLKPIKKELYVYVGNRGEKKIVDTIKPYTKGFYSFKIPLKPSLNLKENGYNQIELRNKKNIILAQNYFSLEEYELKKTSFTLETPNREQYRSKKFEIILNGKDENDLPLFDATYSIIITSKNVINTYLDKELVSDTLLCLKNVKMKGADPTIVEISDSIFPNMNIGYKISVTFRTSDNEVVTKETECTFFNKKKDVVFTEVNDSLNVNYTENGTPKIENIEITYSQPQIKDSVVTLLKALKTAIGIPNKYSTLIAKVGDFEKTYDLSNVESKISWSSKRNSDSVYFKLENPRHIPVSYFMFKGNRLMDYGTDTNIIINKKSAGYRFVYTIIFSYTWAGEIQTKRIEIPLEKYILNIKVDQKSIIAPGQKIDLGVIVTNYKGKPVKNVDITAWAFTSKFGSQNKENVFCKMPKKFNKTNFNQFNLKNNSTNTFSNNLTKKIFNQSRLDTIMFYNFIYPNNSIFKYSYSTQDSTTQVAPFIVRNGNVLQSHIVEIDWKPVYYSWTTNVEPYSFLTTSSNHSIYIRLDSMIINIKNVKLPFGKKTILSIDLDKCTDTNVIVTKPQTIQFSTTDLNYYNSTTMQTKNNSFNQFLIQDSTVYELSDHRYSPNILLGPIFENDITFVDVNSKYLYDFIYEPKFNYFFGKNAVKMFPSTELLDLKNWMTKRKTYSLSDESYTRKNIYPLIKNSTPQPSLPNIFTNINSLGEIVIVQKKDAKIEQGYICLQSFSDSTSCRFFFSSAKTIYNVPQGNYKLWFFSSDTNVVMIDSVSIKDNARLFVNYHSANQKSMPQIVKQEFRLLLNNNYIYHYDSDERDKSPKYTINKIDFHTTPCTNCIVIKGTVMDGEFGGGLPGANVIVKGTNSGTSTDIDGNYSININGSSGTLVFQSIGFKSVSINVNSSSIVNLTLKKDLKQIEEVVKVGYGVQKKTDVTGSVSEIEEGRSWGYRHSVPNELSDSGNPGSDATVRIRGTGSISNSDPLYVVDGVPQDGTPKINPSEIMSISVLKDASSCAKYGSRGANGVIIITTKNNTGSVNPFQNGDGGGVDLSLFSGKRTKFKDDAFWNPSLLTNNNGKVSFSVTFPDDITNWKTNYIAYKGRGYSGVYRGNIKAMKPLTSQLFIPQFLVEGDTSWCIGKSINYLSESQKIKIKKQVNGIGIETDTLLGQIIIDSIQVVGKQAKDSVKLFYQLSKDNYVDAETRYIPIYPKGRMETVGQFKAIRDSLSRTIIPDDKKSKLAVYAENMPLSAMLKEIENIHKYPYWCNEQIASKLIALIFEKRLELKLGKPFTQSDEVTKLINKLDENKNQEGFWGWWNKSQTESWISLHVIDALLMAKQEGYKTTIDIYSLGEQLVRMLQSKKYTNQIQILLTLLSIDSKFNIEPYLKEAQKESKTGIANYFSYLELLQKIGKPANLDTLNFYKIHPRVNQMAFQAKWHGCYLPYTNNMQLNLIAYRLLKKDSCSNVDSLQMMRDYFLDQRKNGNWLNTYESVSVLNTILPDLMNENLKDTVTTLLLTYNGTEKKITQFPFKDSLPACEVLKVKKMGISPVYFTSTQTRFNNHPIAEIKPFTVKTFLNDNESQKVILKAGTPTELRVQVYMTYTSEYVMIDVPIPAGCSYTTKPQPDSYREYKKDRTIIFCNHLSEGMHTFIIPITPRYNGLYTINPARAEQMYFPTEHGQEGLKRIIVK